MGWSLLFTLVALTLPVRSGQAIQSRADGTGVPDLAAVYAEAVAKLLGDPGDQEFILLPSAVQPELAQESRRGSGEAHRASPAVARDVAARLALRGYRGSKGIRSTIARTGALQIVLGELRFEPARRPSFARLTMGVVGSDGAMEKLEFLLKREGPGWRALKFEIEGTIG